eukprot:5846640-Pyramimonas_sp.AAC.1
MWEIHDGPSTYDANASRLHLHYTRGDSEAGRRAYVPDIMDALKCHQGGRCRLATHSSSSASRNTCPNSAMRTTTSG